MKISRLIVLVVVFLFSLSLSAHAVLPPTWFSNPVWSWPGTQTKTESSTDLEIKQAARRSSVQPVFHIPVLKVYWCKPDPEEPKEWYTREEIEELLKERIMEKEDLEETIKKIIADYRRQWDVDKFEGYLTDIDVYGYLSPTPNFVPLGALAPKGAKFPQRVVVVTEIDEKELKAWEKDYEKDIMTISEVAEVSLPQAKSIISRLGFAGYRILRKEEKVEQVVKLLWFKDGWDDEYPRTLSWSVELEGTKQNIITGYGGDGLLEVSPIPKNTRVHVKAGYLNLVEKYRPKEPKLMASEDRIKTLEKLLDETREDLKEKEDEIRKLTEEEEEEVRDISKVTWLDVLIGRVCIKRFYFVSAASGTFLGNMQVDNEMYGYQSWFMDIHNIQGDTKGVVLTNAHVAQMSIAYEVYVSKDKQVMWIFYPAYTSIRYTRDSDIIGSPAQVLFREHKPVMTWDYDAALMVTSEVPYLEPYAAKLGNSDKVKIGDRIVSVGNPAMMQKYTTQGVVSNKDYSALNSLNADWWIQYIPSLQVYNWIKNSNFWYDAPIGTGGTSGSGVWELDGSERGKIIALHNMGMNVPLGVTGSATEECDFNPQMVEQKEEKILLTSYLRDKREVLFQDMPYTQAKYDYNIERFAKEQEGFEEAAMAHGYWVRLSGMNGAVPINPIKVFLQERGMDPEKFGWGKANEEYWEK